MITREIKGNILESTCQTLTVTVNTVGVMGKGLALDFKNAYPKLYNIYRNSCLNGTFFNNGLFIHTHSDTRKIWCAPTKRHWGNPSKIEWIDISLYSLARYYKEYGITSIAIPPLGCGNGGLNWDDVYVLIKEHLNPIPIDVHIYVP